MRMGATSSIPLVHAPEHSHCRRGYCFPTFGSLRFLSPACPHSSLRNPVVWIPGTPSGRKRIYYNLMVNSLSVGLENCGIIGDKLDGINNGPGRCGQGQL